MQAIAVIAIDLAVAVVVNAVVALLLYAPAIAVNTDYGNMAALLGRPLVWFRTVPKSHE